MAITGALEECEGWVSSCNQACRGCRGHQLLNNPDCLLTHEAAHGGKVPAEASIDIPHGRVAGLNGPCPGLSSLISRPDFVPPQSPTLHAVRQCMDRLYRAVIISNKNQLIIFQVMILSPFLPFAYTPP